MSTFKCGLRRFDGHGTRYTERPVNTDATREMESALERLRRSREAQDSGCFVAPSSTKVPIQPIAVPVLKKAEVEQKTCYSLSDSTNAPK